MECAPYGKVRKDIDGCRGEINGHTEMSRWDFFFERVGCGANYGLTLVVVGIALFLRVLRRSFWLWLQCASFTARAVPKFVYFVFVVWRALIGAVFNGALPVIL